jgi:hypothetical protein
MQLTVRSYLMAGLAAAGAGALAIAPLPSVTPADVKIPTVEAPVALAAAPTFEQLLAFGIADATGLTVAPFSSASAANAFVGTDIVSSVTTAQLIIAATQAGQIDPPLAALALGVGLPVQALGAGDAQFFGVNDPGVVQAANPANNIYSIPGEPDTTTGVVLVPSPGIMPTVVTPINKATSKVALDFDNVSASVGGPRLASPVTSGAQRVGTSIVQAQGLVRTAAVGAVGGVATAALTNGDVAGAVRSGADGVVKSVFGDSTVPLVNKTTKKATTSADPNAVAPVRRLGAIGTVSSTVQKAASDVGNSISGGS